MEILLPPNLAPNKAKNHNFETKVDTFTLIIEESTSGIKLGWWNRRMIFISRFTESNCSSFWTRTFFNVYRPVSVPTPPPKVVSLRPKAKTKLGWSNPAAKDQQHWIAPHVIHWNFCLKNIKFRDNETPVALPERNSFHGQVRTSTIKRTSIYRTFWVTTFEQNSFHVTLLVCP